MTARHSFTLAIVLGCSLATPAAAQQTAATVAFRMERPIVTNGAGPRRLAVDVPILAGAAGQSLADLRLFDASGREVPYLFVSKPPVAPSWAAANVLPVAPVDTPTRKTSGFEADFGEARLVDRFRFELSTTQPFLKRVRLEGSGDRAHWTVLVLEGTVFNLPDEKLRETELAFTAGPYRYLRVTWDDTSSARLPPTASVEARLVTDVIPAPPLTTALAVERRPSEPGVSRYRLRLPGAHLPVVALTFDLGGGHVLRDASVYETRLSGTALAPVLLGKNRLQRVVQGSLSASSLAIRVNPSHEPQLDLVVDDGSNPPLDVRGVSAVLAEQPWIYFESDGSALVARYGSPVLTAPRYDIEAMRDTLRAGISRVADATWGQPRTRSADEQAGSPPPAFPTVGSSVDPSGFSVVRELPAGDAGLMALPLDAAVLAHSAGAFGNFADVRVIDASDRQVPYLVERVSEPLSLDLQLTTLEKPPAPLASSSAKKSFYRIVFPYEQLPSSRLVLTTSGRVFRRSLTIAVERQPGRHHREPWVEPLGSAMWAHADQDTAAPAVTIAVAPVDSRELLLIVDEGDNSPIPIASARVLLPSYQLRFFRAQGTPLRLAYGRRDLAAPTYDLTLLAPQVLGVTATEIAASGEQTSQESTSTAAIVSPRFFWVTLVIAVVVLLGLIVRLVTKEQPIA